MVYVQYIALSLKNEKEKLQYESCKINFKQKYKTLNDSYISHEYLFMSVKTIAKGLERSTPKD